MVVVEKIKVCVFFYSTKNFEDKENMHAYFISKG